jgi:glucosamine--fructose-6-phosphate aminotransferase (isomerizing)
VRVIGHGSSDAAAAFAVYAFGLLPGWTAVRDSISLLVYYEAHIDLADSVVVALSQSGRTPDVVSYVQRARAQGAWTIALTNEPGSELARAAETSLPLAAGEEQSVAASKTYLNTLAAIALLAGACALREQETADALRQVADLLATNLDRLERAVSEVALAFAYVGRMYVIGRGMEIATAREIALKLKETCRVAAEPLTATDLVHGPVATLDALFPVWVIASRDAGLQAVLEAAQRARDADATLVASGSAATDVAGAAHVLPVPEAPLPVLAPLLSVVPGQLFAATLARAKGLDPDRPEGLTKVTLAR